VKQEYTAATWPTDRWPNFSIREMCCSHTGLCFLDGEMMDNLQTIRSELRKPFKISSGYRHDTNPAETKKELGPGSHFTGKAIDIVCSGQFALDLIQEALAAGFSGLGVKQHGDHSKRFLHFDSITAEDNFHAPRPALWSYQ
jgi:zinc D-Ala-D-Ala carboxypeptidase